MLTNKDIVRAHHKASVTLYNIESDYHRTTVTFHDIVGAYHCMTLRVITTEPP